MKTNKILNYLMLVALLMVPFLFTSCNDESGTARLVVRLTDSPGDYEQVNVDIQGVQVHAEDGNQTDGWIDLQGVNTGVYNLLDLTDGVEVVLADTEFPTGHITQMRLILGDNNTLVKEGSTDEIPLPLTTPSAQQTGLKLLINETLLEGITYSFLLDFDATKSVVKAGASGMFILQPVIKVITEATSGAIEGEALPASEIINVRAMQGTDTVGASFTMDNASEFLIGGLPDGSYDVVFDPGEMSNLQLDTLFGIEVNIGEVTNVGTVELTQ